MNCLENLFGSENFEHLMEESKQILDELEKDGNHLDGLKLESWSPTNQDEWANGLPIDMKLLNPNLSFADESFGNESMAEPCLFVSKYGDKVYTCSFPASRGSLLEENAHVAHSLRPPPYYESHFNNAIQHKNDPQKFSQVPSIPEVMRGSFMPRYPADHPIYYISDACNQHSDKNLPSLDFDSNSLHPSPPFQFQDQQVVDSYIQQQNMLVPDGRKYPLSNTEESRKRPASPHDHLPTKQPTMFYNNNNNNNNNNSSFDDMKASFMHNKLRNSFSKAVNGTDSPATFSSDTTTGTSPGGSNSLEKSSIPSPDQTNEDADQRSSVEWQPFRYKSWCKLYSADQNEVTITVKLNVDKGFNFSHVDDSFVCQRKNHFQVTMTFHFSHQPQFVELDNKLIAISSIYLYFYGIKSESESHIVTIEQSESDRSKHLYQPVKINLNEIRPNQPLKAVVGRLHFGETTLNNMRKRGKPNPDQRFFRLVVSLGTNLNDDNNTPEPRFPIIAHASEKIIVRASNPNQFESDPESLWVKGKTGDSICHYGNVGINTKSPTEALTIHGSVKITGQLLEPSDVRIKTEIKELSTKEQLKNITLINMYQYRYLPSYEEYAGLKNSPHKLADGSCSALVPKVGVLAQQVSQILPDAVQVVGDVVLPDGNILEGFLVVNKDRIFMEGLGAVKELCNVTNNLEQRIKKIEIKNEELNQFNNQIAKTVLSASSSNTSNNHSAKIISGSKTKNTGKGSPPDVKDATLFMNGYYNHEPLSQSGQEKVIKFFKVHWKMTLLAIAISLALICGIIGMAFGILSHRDSTESVTTFTTPLFTTKTTALHVKYLSCNSSIQACVPSPCGDEEEIDVSSGIFPSKEMKCTDEVMPAPHNPENHDPTTAKFIKNTFLTSVSPEINDSIPTVSDTIQNETNHDAQTSLHQEYVVSTQPLILSENASTHPTNSSMVDEPMLNNSNSDYNNSNEGTINNDRSNNKPDMIETTTPQIQFKSFSVNFDFQITLPAYNETLKSSNGATAEFNFILANDFPQNISIIAEISLSKDTDIALCSWKRKDWPGRKQTEFPCFRRRFPNFMNSRWDLPVCFYQTSSFVFLVYNQDLKGQTCYDLEATGQTKKYEVKFTRQCN